MDDWKTFLKNEHIKSAEMERSCMELQYLPPGLVEYKKNVWKIGGVLDGKCYYQRVMFVTETVYNKKHCSVLITQVNDSYYDPLNVWEPSSLCLVGKSSREVVILQKTHFDRRVEMIQIVYYS